MLAARIISTLRFFDLQDIPLTLLELYKFLVAEKTEIKNQVDTEFEYIEGAGVSIVNVSLDEMLSCLQNRLRGQIEEKNGYYCLPGRGQIITSRLNNYFYGFKREKRLKRYGWFLKFLPFVRGVALGGSQSLGQQKENSDIDLLIITQEKFMWLARTLVSFYLQLFGVRRYASKTRNRFCLNHYLGQPKVLDRERNLYKAMEYSRLRPIVYGQTIATFQQNNSHWIRVFFPNFAPVLAEEEKQPSVQRLLEKIFNNRFGFWLERWLKKIETARIKQDRYTFITEDELSFHPESRHNQLLQKFFA